MNFINKRMMMKKFFILIVAALLSSCATWNSMTENWSWDWNWNALNPWSSAEDATEPEEKEVQTPVAVNKYLWQASLDRLTFMGINSENPQTGRITTNWKSMPSAPNERFKIVAEIEGQELRADALDIIIYKEVNGKNGWIKSAPSETLKNEIEQAIISKAKILYINDDNKE